MSNLERLQKYIILAMVLLALVLAGAIFSLVTGGEEPQAEPASTAAEELTEVKWNYPDNLILGKRLTNQSFTLPNGKKTQLGDHLGENLTLAVYWGSWCSYCEEQTKLLCALEDTLDEQNVKVLLIDKLDPEKESLEAAKAKIQEENISFDWIIDSDLSVYQELGLHIIPTSFLLDREGKVLFCKAGRIQSEEELASILDYAKLGPAVQTERFVTEHLMTPDGGVQLHAVPQSGAHPRGQDVLSESQGLIMEYAALTGNAALFKEAYGYVQTNLSEEGLLRWYGSADGEPGQVNALLDDLRILRALDSVEGYGTEVFYRAQALARCNLDKEGNLVDFYTFSDGSQAHQMSMCYGDFRALDILAREAPQCAQAVEKVRKLVEGAYLGDDFPFYANFYDYEAGRYDEGSLNMAEAMLNLLQQAQAGELKESSLNWIKTAMAGDGIWARYDTKGNVVSGYRYQSAAVYGLVGLIAVEVEDQALLTQAVSRMEQYRCFRKGNDLDGAVASSMEEVSSFDQCVALVLYAKL